MNIYRAQFREDWWLHTNQLAPDLFIIINAKIMKENVYISERVSVVQEVCSFYFWEDNIFHKYTRVRIFYKIVKMNGLNS